MIGLTLCSGIGAPEVAAPWVDWRLASEIEAFPRAVLQHRLGYKLPADHNQGDPLLWGDMTEVTPDLLRAHGIPLPNLVVAGTPCQAFSVAGRREGLADPRGNLTLAFVEILHGIVAARPDGKLIALWENVPGVLSDKENAFGCFLGGLVGALDALPRPAGGIWPGEGMVEGPRARAAWAVLDSQWFGVAQRRRRVFVVVDFGGACDPAAILLEPDSLRGDSAPRRGPGEGTAERSGAGPAVGGVQGFGGGNTSGPIEVAACLVAKGQKCDFEVETFVAHTLRGEGFDASEDGTGRGTPLVPVHVFDPNQITSKTNRSVPTPELCHTLPGTPNAPIAFAIQERAVSTNMDAGPQGKGWQPEIGYTLKARNKVQAVAFAHQAGGKQTTLGYSDDGVCQTIGANQTPAVALGHNGGPGWAVRRLTPRECERLQAFPDDWTNIPWRGKDTAPDGPRYKAVGNSMTTNTVRWIMDRIRESAGHV
jgi:DNA (cytosine-5)-methyltransferase 1